MNGWNRAQTLRLMLAMLETGGAGGASPASTPSSGESDRIEWGASPAAPQPRPASPRRPTKRRKPATHEDPRIDWGDSAPQAALDPARLVGVEDAFEHTPLEPGEQVAYCKFDGVAYHLGTWDFLRKENGGRCCSCGRTGTIVLVSLPGKLQQVPSTPEYIPAWLEPGQELIGLDAVPDAIGRAVVVEAHVHEVYRTRNTGAYFIRFEPRESYDPPFTGFKVVIFARYASAWERHALDPMLYAGHTVRVRGLIQEHPLWGIEILVNSPRLIQVVDAPASPVGATWDLP